MGIKLLGLAGAHLTGAPRGTTSDLRATTLTLASCGFWLLAAVAVGLSSPATVYNQQVARVTVLYQGVTITAALIAVVAAALCFPTWRHGLLGRVLRATTAVLVITSALYGAVDRHILSRYMWGELVNVPSVAGNIMANKTAHAFLAEADGYEAQVRSAVQQEVFLIGDSYTVGSGAAPACNYPDRMAAVLAENGMQVRNLGVAGTGLLNYSRLVGVLRARYDEPQYIVNLFVGNDFYDNLPGTYRSVVSGMFMERMPEASALSPFNVLDWRISRTIMSVGMWIAAGPSSARGDVRPACAVAATPLVETQVRWYADRISAVVTREIAELAPTFRSHLETIRGQVEASGTVLIVIFPDRMQVDHRMREEVAHDRLEAYLEDLQAVEEIIYEVFKDLPVVGLRSELDWRHYGNDATHLNDAGNTVAAAIVSAVFLELVEARRGR